MDKAPGQAVGTATLGQTASVEFPAFKTMMQQVTTLHDSDKQHYDAKEVEVQAAATDDGQGQLAAKSHILFRRRFH